MKYFQDQNIKEWLNIKHLFNNILYKFSIIYFHFNEHGDNNLMLQLDLAFLPHFLVILKFLKIHCLWKANLN